MSARLRNGGRSRARSINNDDDDSDGQEPPFNPRPSNIDWDAKESKQTSLLLRLIPKLKHHNFEAWEEALADAAYQFRWAENILKPKKKYVWDEKALEDSRTECNRRCAYMAIKDTASTYHHLFVNIRRGDATAAYAKVKSHFHRNTTNYLIQLQKQFTGLTMANTGLHVMQFAARVSKVAKRLNAVGGSTTDIQILTVFLAGLLPDLKEVRNYISRGQLSDLSYEQVVAEVYDYACENGLENLTEEDPKTKANTFIANTTPPPLQCSCEHCPKHNNKPPRKPGFEPSGAGGFRGKCNYCGKAGHKERDCRRKQRDERDEKKQQQEQQQQQRGAGRRTRSDKQAMYIEQSDSSDSAAFAGIVSSRFFDQEPDSTLPTPRTPRSLSRHSGRRGHSNAECNKQRRQAQSTTAEQGMAPEACKQAAGDTPRSTHAENYYPDIADDAGKSDSGPLPLVSESSSDSDSEPGSIPSTSPSSSHSGRGILGFAARNPLNHRNPSMNQGLKSSLATKITGAKFLRSVCPEPKNRFSNFNALMIATTAANFPADSWVGDDGANVHITNDAADFFPGTTRQVHRELEVGSGKMVANLQGDILAEALATGAIFMLRGALLLPACKHKLLSNIKFNKNGCVTTSDGKCKIVKLGGRALLSGELRGGLYRFDIRIHHKHPPEYQPTTGERTTAPSNVANPGPAAIHNFMTFGASSTANFASQLLEAHRRYAHLNFRTLRKQLGLPQHGDNPPCASCAVTKARKQPMPKIASRRSTRVIHRLHMDFMFGPKFIAVVFICDYSRKGWLAELKAKSEWLESFKIRRRKLENDKAPWDGRLPPLRF